MEMIVKVKNAKLAKLNGAEYIHFIDFIERLVETATPNKLGLSEEFFSDFKKRLEELRNSFNRSKVSEETNILNKLNKKRDKIIVYLFSNLRTEKVNPISDKSEIAENLYNNINSYNKLQNLPNRQKTQVIENLILDLNKPENKEYIDTLELSEVIEKLDSINKEYKDCEIIEIEKSSRFTIKGKKLVEGKWSEVENFKLEIYQINRIDDEKNSEISNEIRTKKDEWEKIIDRRNHDFKVCDLYKRLYEEQLELDPFYQRDYVWNLEQKRLYIENLFLDKAVITPTFIQVEKPKELRKDFSDFDILEVLDGKQRLSTIFEFIENQFCLNDGIYFKNLNGKDKIELLFMDVKAIEILPRKFSNQLTDKQKIELFLEINELGTKMSDEHIEKIKREYLE